MGALPGRRFTQPPHPPPCPRACRWARCWPSWWESLPVVRAGAEAREPREMPSRRGRVGQVGEGGGGGGDALALRGCCVLAHHRWRPGGWRGPCKPAEGLARTSLLCGRVCVDCWLGARQVSPVWLLGPPGGGAAVTGRVWAPGAWGLAHNDKRTAPPRACKLLRVPWWAGLQGTLGWCVWCGGCPGGGVWRGAGLHTWLAASHKNRCRRCRCCQAANAPVLPVKCTRVIIHPASGRICGGKRGSARER
jgi:hypothetical protein